MGFSVADLQVTGLLVSSPNQEFGPGTIQNALGDYMSGAVTGDLGIQINVPAPSPDVTAFVAEQNSTVRGSAGISDFYEPVAK